MIKLVECPRDAMQGIHEFIPTEEKKTYINSLLKVGFDTIDFGSFVSPNAIPQMQDTKEVLSGLDLSGSKTKLLAIIANYRGAEEACEYEEISYLGFPFSISETFQLRNTNSTILKSLETVKNIQDLVVKKNKKLVIYISMGFGNPYGDPWSPEIVNEWVDKLFAMGIRIISLADTVGVSTKENINLLFSHLIPHYPSLELGAHLHSHPLLAREKVTTAIESGCRRIDAALLGFGGCPMAKDDLVGNIATEVVLKVLEGKKMYSGLDNSALLNSTAIATTLFGKYR